MARTHLGNRRMSIDIADRIGSNVRFHVPFIAWAIAFAAIFAYGGYSARQNEQYRHALALWEKAQAQHILQAQVALGRVRNILSNLIGKPDSQRELEQQIKRGQPFELRREGDVEVTTCKTLTIS